MSSVSKYLKKPYSDEHTYFHFSDKYTEAKNLFKSKGFMMKLRAGVIRFSDMPVVSFNSIKNICEQLCLGLGWVWNISVFSLRKLS